MVAPTNFTKGNKQYSIGIRGGKVDRTNANYDAVRITTRNDGHIGVVNGMGGGSTGTSVGMNDKAPMGSSPGRTGSSGTTVRQNEKMSSPQ